MLSANLIVLFAISLVCSFFSNAVYRSISKRYKILIDLPDKNRKFHKRPTPLTGGISILTGYILAILFAIGLNVFNFTNTVFDISILICSVLIMLIFMIDDTYGLSPRIRLLAQIMVAGLLIILSDIYILDLGDLLHIGNINLGAFGPAFTIFCVVGLMNAFNMVDGINGLCSGLGALIFLCLGIFYNGFIGTQLIYALGAICGFLIFNLEIIGRKRLVFLGDHGSNLMGFVVAFSLISASQDPVFNFKPVTALWFVAIPLFDCLGLIFKRMYRGVRPFDADRDHLHHRFMDAGCSSRQTLVMLIIISSIMSLIGMVLQRYTNEFISLMFFVFFSSIFYYFSYLLKEYALKLKEKMFKPIKNLKT